VRRRHRRALPLLKHKHPSQINSFALKTTHTNSTITGYEGIVDFYARQQNASRVLAMHGLGVCLSGTLLYRIKTVQARITKSSLWLPQGL